MSLKEPLIRAVGGKLVSPMHVRAVVFRAMFVVSWLLLRTGSTAAPPNPQALAGLEAGSPRPALVSEKIRDDLYVISGDGCNVTLLITNEGVILVDDNYAFNHDALLAQIRTITSQPVKYVFNTHYHDDHSGGNARFSSSATIISHRNSRTNILHAKQSKAEPGVEPARVVFTEEISVFLGGKEVRARYFGRAHTDGDIVVYFPAHKIVCTGDLMVGVTPLIDYSGGGSLVEWTKTIDSIMDNLDFDGVVPGHGRMRDRARMKAYRDSVVKMRAEITELIRAGKTQEEVRLALTAMYPSSDGKPHNYAIPDSLHSEWSLPGFMNELK